MGLDEGFHSYLAEKVKNSKWTLTVQTLALYQNVITESACLLVTITTRKKNVPIKKGRRYGIGRTSEAISSSSSQLSVSSSSIVQYMERMKTELDEERTKRQAIEEQLRSVTTFISNLYPEQFSATQTQPDSATQSPDDQCF
ncbi:hypothetical protein F2Q68_00014069 [Brassica cretica]|uniref:Uncharacterized protein n=1 Tax=Brassica cretica TaxID=69181 RepID=A0A8S9HIQ7_BRACR|nr:hypothetical protein F2Q68_00014069 [Brassica cretica]